jgi:predicted flavoprotein YhiN
VLGAAQIDTEALCNTITRESRVRLMKTLKHLRFEAKNLLGMDKAVVTAGGVALTEVDFKTMRSLKYKNLSLVGDILDIDRPSGGYSLQMCWTTGFVAGSAAAKQ